MKFVAKARFLRYSPYKLRPIADAIRGKRAQQALAWLVTYKTKRALPIMKLIESAVANARNLKNIEPADLIIKELCVDQGPIHKYFKPGTMGRAMPQRRRMCHMSVTLEPKKHIQHKEA